jgi:Sulfate permease family
MELIAQGAGNITSALFGGIPATGAIARTATNIKSGGRTPIAGVVSSIDGAKKTSPTISFKLSTAHDSF